MVPTFANNQEDRHDMIKYSQLLYWLGWLVGQEVNPGFHPARTGSIASTHLCLETSTKVNTRRADWTTIGRMDFLLSLKKHELQYNSAVISTIGH